MKNDKEVVVNELPKCGFCDHVDARFDAKTVFGWWANMCFFHWEQYAEYKELGMGKGQNLILPDEVL